jgi:hypothetical protein
MILSIMMTFSKGQSPLRGPMMVDELGMNACAERSVPLLLKVPEKLLWLDLTARYARRSCEGGVEGGNRKEREVVNEGKETNRACE